jgi:hypothetical protein
MTEVAEPASEETGQPAPPSAEAHSGGTGQPEVDAALEHLRVIDTLPVSEQVEVYDEVQQRLAAAMDDTRDGQPPSGPA